MIRGAKTIRYLVRAPGMALGDTDTAEPQEDQYGREREAAERRSAARRRADCGRAARSPGGGQSARGLATRGAGSMLASHVGLVRQPVPRSDAAPGLCTGNGRPGRVNCIDGDANATRNEREDLFGASVSGMPRGPGSRSDGELYRCRLLDCSGVASPERNRHGITADWICRLSGRPGRRACNDSRPVSTALRFPHLAVRRSPDFGVRPSV